MGNSRDASNSEQNPEGPNSMTNSESNLQNATGLSGPKKAVERRLDESGLTTDRFIDLHPGTKTPAQKWRDDGLGKPAEAIEEDHAIKCGNNLVVIDVDHPEKLPVELPSTFAVRSPHGDAERGHLYYRVEEPIENHREKWGSIQSDGSIVVGPGSTLDHDGYCKDDCILTGESAYEIADGRPFAILDRETIDAITTRTAEKKKSEEQFQPVDNLDEGLVARAETNMRDFQSNCAGLAFHDLLELLNGGTGSIDGLRHDNGDIDRDKADLEALWMLYGVMQYAHENTEDARNLAYIAYTYYCKETPYGKDGRKRKWLTRSEGYRLNRLQAAVNGFDFGEWHRWRRRENADGYDNEDYRNWTGDYSDICYDLALAVIDIHCGLDPNYVSKVRGVDLSPPTHCHKIPPGGTFGESHNSVDCNYPSTSQVREVAAQIDSRSEATFKSVLQRLQRRGVVKVACIKEGLDYRVYPAELSDPPEAEWVKSHGERYTTESIEAEEETSKRVMTDGGAEMGITETHNKLEQIRNVRRGSENTSDDVEIYVCPIDGCGRTVVGDPGHLRNHVSQSIDNDHRGLTLDSNLEIVVSWGPGVRDDPEPDGEWSIYDNITDLWGPGVPE